MKMERCHNPKFINALYGSQSSVLIVGLWLLNKGYQITIDPLSLEKTDNGDLSARKDGKDFLFEVKSRPGLSFTCADDFPYKEKGMFVSNKNSADKRLENTTAWIVLSATKRHIAIIRPESHKQWHVVKTKPKNKENEETFYSCPLEHISFKNIF